MTPSLPPPSVPVGARLLQFAILWHQITSDAWVLETVSRGYSLEFLRKPQDRFWQVLFSRVPATLSTMLDALNHLLSIGAVEEVPLPERNSGVYLISFSVSKMKQRDAGDPRFKVDKFVPDQSVIQGFSSGAHHPYSTVSQTV